MNDIGVFFDEPMLLGECPLWEPREGALYWIDIEGRAIHRVVERTGAHSSWSLPSEPGCIARAKDGLVVAMRSGIFSLDTHSGRLTELVASPFDRTEQRFNDGRCDAMGRLWVGTIHEPRDGPKATLYCVEGSHIVDAGVSVTVSNGLAFSPDGRKLYHADTTSHTISVYEFDLAAGRISGSGQILREFESKRDQYYGGRPDGAAVDCEGAYWVAMYEGSRILRLSPDGEIVQEMQVPVRCPTMVAFGGDDMKTVFITSARFKRPADELQNFPLSGKVLRTRVEVAGRPEPLFRI